MMAAARQFDPAIPRRVQLNIDVPARLSSKVIEQQIEMFGSHLRFVLGGYYREQARERAEARCAAKGNAKALALQAAARDAEAQEAAAAAAAGRRCATA